MTIGRPVLLIFALVPYVLYVSAFVLVALYAWHAWGFEPVPVPIPTPVPAAPTIGSEVGTYATGAGALGGLGAIVQLVRLVARFFTDTTQHMKNEEQAVRDQTAAVREQTAVLREQAAMLKKVADYIDEIELLDKLARREAGVPRADTDRLALGVPR